MKAYLSLRKCLKDSFLDLVGVFMETHVLQHHDTAEQKGSWVRKCLALNIGCRTVDGFEDGALVTDVSGWCQTQSSDQSSAHIRQDVSVQVRHNQNLVVVWGRIGDHLQAGVVQELCVEFDLGELLRDIPRGTEEETIGHLHDSGLVDNTNLVLSYLLSILEGESEYTLGGFPRDELDALNHTIHNHVLNAGIFTLSVLTDQHGVDVIVGCLVTGDRSARADIGEKVECSTESKVQRDVALANRGLFIIFR